MPDDVIGASPDGMHAGATDMRQTAEQVMSAYEELKELCARFAYAGGQGDKLADAFAKAYKPGETACLQFMQMLSALLSGHAGDVDTAGSILQSADSDATTLAGGKR